MTSVFIVLATFLVLTIGLLAYAVNRSESEETEPKVRITAGYMTKSEAE